MKKQYIIPNTEIIKADCGDLMIGSDLDHADSKKYDFEVENEDLFEQQLYRPQYNVWDEEY